MNYDADNSYIEYSNITRLSVLSTTDHHQEHSLNTIVIHPSTTRLTSKSEADATFDGDYPSAINYDHFAAVQELEDGEEDDDDDQHQQEIMNVIQSNKDNKHPPFDDSMYAESDHSSADSSSSSTSSHSASYSVSEGHTHSLSPSTQINYIIENNNNNNNKARISMQNRLFQSYKYRLSRASFTNSKTVKPKKNHNPHTIQKELEMETESKYDPICNNEQSDDDSGSELFSICDDDSGSSYTSNIATIDDDAEDILSNKNNIKFSNNNSNKPSKSNIGSIAKLSKSISPSVSSKKYSKKQRKSKKLSNKKRHSESTNTININGKKHQINHSNHYKQLEQQMIVDHLATNLPSALSPKLSESQSFQSVEIMTNSRSPHSTETTSSSHPHSAPGSPLSPPVHSHIMPIQIGNIVHNHNNHKPPVRRVRSQQNTHHHHHHQHQHQQHSLYPQTQQSILPSLTLTHRQLSQPLTHSNDYLQRSQQQQQQATPTVPPIQPILNYSHSHQGLYHQQYASPSPSGSPQNTPPTFTAAHSHNVGYAQLTPPHKPSSQPQQRETLYRNRFNTQPAYLLQQYSNTIRAQSDANKSRSRAITTFHPQTSHHSHSSTQSPHQKHAQISPGSGGRGNVTFYAYNHDNGTMIQLDTPIMTARKFEEHMSLSYSPHGGTTSTTTPQSASGSPTQSMDTMDSDSTTMDVSSFNQSGTTLMVNDYMDDNNNQNGTYWNIATNCGDKYLLTDYAISHFQIFKHQKKGSLLFASKVNDADKKINVDLNFLNELVSFAPFKKLKHSLLKMENREMDKMGMQIWKNINSYMGLRKSSKSRDKHVDKIMNLALNSNIANMQNQQMIRDEIFCQIVKQTNLDKRNLKQYKRLLMNTNYFGWKLMCICCSIFCPSVEFSKYLACYLYKMIKENEYENNQISQYATFSLNALNQTMIIGSRKMEPTALEMTQIENRQPIQIRVYLLDNSFISILISSQTTVKQICEMISKKLKLKYPTCFALHEMEDIAIKKFYESEVKSYNKRLDMNYAEKVDHLERMPFKRELSDGERIMDTLSSWNKLKSKANKNLRLVFRLKILNKTKVDKDLFSLNEWRIIYLEHVWNVLHNQYPLSSEKDIFHLAAIQLQEKYGNKQQLFDNIDIQQFVPQNILNKYSTKQCKELILPKQYCFYKDFSRKQCWKSYIKYLYESNDASLFVGVSFFRCVRRLKQQQSQQNQQNGHEDLIIGIGENTFLIIHPLTKQIIQRYKLEEILTYGFRSSSFIIVAGTLLQQKKYHFATKYGKDINNILQRYIDIRSSSLFI